MLLARTDSAKTWLSLSLLGSQDIVVKCAAAIFFMYGGLSVQREIC